MKEYDIVVIGAGPGGSAAAKKAAELGASVIMIEEHAQVGIPRRCTGLLMSSKFNAEIRAMVPAHVFITPRRLVRVYAPSGKLLKEVNIGAGGACLTNRSEMDKELAKLAVNAGSAIMINTKVTGLLKKNGKIAGVTTNSKEMPEIHGKVVIVAGGLPSFTSGIPREEGLTDPKEVFIQAVMLELANVNDIEPDVIEWWYSEFETTAGCFFFEPVDAHSCITDSRDLELFNKIKNGNYPFSYKIKNSYPVRMWGTGPSRENVGKPLAKTYKDGMMLIGSAAGFNGIQPAILTGRFAAEVAMDSIRAGNVSEAKLARYQDLWKATGMEHLYDYWRSLRLAMSGMKDKSTLEKDLIDRVKRGEELITSFVENYL